MFCAAASSSSDAGRRPIALPISTVPTHTPKIVHVAADHLQAALDVQVINPAGDTPVATSPVPMNALKRAEDVEALAVVNRRKARLSRDDLALAEQASFLKHVRTLDRLEALAILEGRELRPVQEELILSGREAVEEARDLHRSEALAILEGRKTSSAQEDLVLAVAWTYSLKRAGTTGKWAGFDILGRRKSRKTRLFGGSIVQAHLRP